MGINFIEQCIYCFVWLFCFQAASYFHPQNLIFPSTEVLHILFTIFQKTKLFSPEEIVNKKMQFLVNTATKEKISPLSHYIFCLITKEICSLLHKHCILCHFSQLFPTVTLRSSKHSPPWKELTVDSNLLILPYTQCQLLWIKIRF